MSLNVVFMGTPEAAIPTLDALARSNHSVLAVMTSEDKPRGRGMNLQPTPIKQRALELNLPVMTVKTLRDQTVRDQVEGLKADLFVVTAFGFILPSQVLKMPPLGCVNVHFSMLPRWRGAAPVQWALLEGDDTTGVTIMQMDEGLDTGPIYSQVEESIREDDSAGTLESRLATRGAELLIDALGSIEAKDLTPIPQDDSLATTAPKLTSEDAHLDWTRPVRSLVNRIRAFNPRPGAWVKWRDMRLKIWTAEVTGEPSSAPPGEISVEREALFVNGGDGQLHLEEVQPEGKTRMSGAEFIRGFRPKSGERFV